MASELSRENGSKRIMFFKRTAAGDIRASKVFSEEEIDNGTSDKWIAQMKVQHAPTAKTASLHQLFDRYVRDISPKKRGSYAARYEAGFFRRLKLTETFKQDRAIGAVTEDMCQAWVDERLDDVAEGTVYREFNTLQDFFRQCGSKRRKKKSCWKIIQSNPMEGAQRPPDSEDAGQVVTPAQLAKLHAEANTDLEKLAIRMFEFAMETGMRRGEVCLIKAKHIGGRIIQLFDGETKSGKGRNIPMGPRAKALVPDNGFDLLRDALGYHFRAVRDRCGFDFRFHDARHTAATNAGNSGKYSDVQLMDWFGWGDFKTARRYIKTDARNIADQMWAEEKLKLAA